MVFSKTTVTRTAKAIFVQGAKIVESRAKGKKYAIIKPDGNRVNLGSIHYEDFTRSDNYLKRAKCIKGNRRNNKYSPNFMRIRHLWNG